MNGGQNLDHYQSRLTQFHAVYGLPNGLEAGKPATYPGITQETLRVSLLEEEFNEYKAAAETHNIVEIADALADMLYVIHGTALVYGIDLRDCFDEVHRSNMSKLGLDGKPIYRPDGKVLKGPNYSPPNLVPIVLQRYV